MTLRELKIENAKVKIAMQNSQSKDSKQYMFIFCMSGIPLRGKPELLPEP